ncbi:MAG: sulfatase-like hydrolase/transferase, partial [Planctomycetota bacterium]|nr:sulfatase-like hydrolase/transferase [Planctomycetota bacterium]
MLLLAAFVSTPFPCAAAQRPNIIVFLVDDIGYGDLEANNPECGIPTPNLNHLAKHGANFMNAHSSASVCAPT